MKKLIADIINGVQAVSDFGDVEVVGQRLFYSMLRDLQDGETIGALVDSEMEEKIFTEYGIKGDELEKIIK